jgi:hypothetical protein
MSSRASLHKSSNQSRESRIPLFKIAFTQQSASDDRPKIKGRRLRRQCDCPKPQPSENTSNAFDL